MDPYGTHQEALIRSVLATTGAVLELGCGYYSTPILHAICEKEGRQLMTCETNQTWLSKFSTYQTSAHRHCLIRDWMTCEEIRGIWSVVLIDHAPAAARVPLIARLRETTQLFVIHDSEDPAYNYEPTLSSFNYRRQFDSLIPWTDVVSDSLNVEILLR